MSSDDQGTIGLAQEGVGITPASEASQNLSYLYPLLDDPEFSAKIASRKEFYDTKYEKPKTGAGLEAIADSLCNATFELAPHQMFVRNFLSFQTPYNGLLLYHGLGSGKTCSAISVCEEMRQYMRQMDISRRTIIVAAPNVQDNFRLQMFDDRKLTLIDGLWNLKACTGNYFLNEINPMSMKGLKRETVVRQVHSIINKSYLFLGYIEFANFIASHQKTGDGLDPAQQADMAKQRLKRAFKGRLIVVDEVHNIRLADENVDKRVASALEYLVKAVRGMRLLFLSATPMYNSPREIVWLLNLLHMNDRRATFGLADIFGKDGALRVEEGSEEPGGLLARKSTGYVSFVRGDNPYTFPFRVWPSEFAPEHTLERQGMPTIQMNGKAILQGLEMVSVYVNALGSVQEAAYGYIVKHIAQASLSKAFSTTDRFGYTVLQRPIEALNMVYPDVRMDQDGNLAPSELVGKAGLARVLQCYTDPNTGRRSYQLYVSPSGKQSLFRYRPDFEDSRMFSPSEIGKYSGKIAGICDAIERGSGVVLVYSQYIDGGLVPLALALEERGYGRAGGTLDLLESAPPPTKGNYVIITGDRGLSPDNASELRRVTDAGNSNGEQVKVILISQAGSEGLDFKFVRQVHIMDPWYNMNRIEQTIGRAVRSKSHCALPFVDRNVEIYLHGSVLADKNLEAADIYVYRVAEEKAVAIGQISRVLKKAAVDCLLQTEQADMGVDAFNMEVQQRLSSGTTIDYRVGDRPYTATCDYMSKCAYDCQPVASIAPDDVKLDTFAEAFILANTDRIVARIRDLFKERHYYTKASLVTEVNANITYPAVQIDAALTRLISDGNEFITDVYGRMGKLVNIGEMYFYQPLELGDSRVSMYGRRVPLDFKRPFVSFTGTEPANMVSPERNTNAVCEDIARKVRIGTDEETSDAPTDAWYSEAAKILPALANIDIARTVVRQSVTNHALESLSEEDTLKLLNSIDDGNSMCEVVQGANSYFANQYMHAEGSRGLLVQSGGKLLLLVQRGENSWRRADSEDLYEFRDAIAGRKAAVTPVAEKCGELTGFMSSWKKDHVVFKVRVSAQKRNKGARCDQSNKSTLLKYLHQLGYPQFGDDTSRGRISLCVLVELLLRQMNIDKVRGLRWFLTPGEFIMSVE